MSSQLSGLQPEPVLVGRRLVGDTGVQRVGAWPYPTRQVGISAGSDHTWASIVAGRVFTCGVNNLGEGYCWASSQGLKRRHP